MQITGTHINYYFVCKRKLWLFANNIQMEHTSSRVSEGNLIHETTYQQRTSKYEEVAIGGIKVDYYDAKNKVIHEVKKSNKIETAHIWQLKYYLFVFEKAGIEGVTGKLEYPKLRQTEEVILSNRDVEELQDVINEIKNIITSETCPGVLNATICKRCSYYDFCFSGEAEQDE